MRIQEDMVHGLLELGPSVAPVIFSDDEAYFQSYCGKGNSASSINPGNAETSPQSRITCISDFKTNPFHLPYIRSLFAKLQDLPFSCRFYGYLNGDILLSPQILDVLNETLRQISAGVFSRHVLVVGRRTNFPWANVSSLASGEAYRAQLRSFCSADAPYMNNAIVAFRAPPHAPGLFFIHSRHVQSELYEGNRHRPNGCGRVFSQLCEEPSLRTGAAHRRHRER